MTTAHKKNGARKEILERAEVQADRDALKASLRRQKVGTLASRAAEAKRQRLEDEQSFADSEVESERSELEASNARLEVPARVVEAVAASAPSSVSWTLTARGIGPLPDFAPTIKTLEATHELLYAKTTVEGSTQVIDHLIHDEVP